MFVAVAAMASVSCQKEENTPVNETKSATLTLQATVADTKTYIEENAVLWGMGEYVQLYFNDGTDKYVKSKADSADLSDGESSAKFSFDITYDEAESYVIGGVYPASAASISDDGTSAKAYKLELPATQNATAASYDPAAYIMIMQPQTVTAIEADAYLASFRRATALNKITLTGVTDDITSVEITVPEDKVLAGRRYFDLTTGVEGEIYYSKTNTVKVNAAYASSSIDVWFTSWGVELAEGEELTVKMTSATKTYTRTIAARAEGIKFVEGDLNKLTVNMSSAEEAVLDNLSGEYLIAAMPGEWMLMSGTNAGSYYNRFESAVASSESEVLCSDFYGVKDIENYVWKVTKMEGGYSVQNNSTGKYLNLTADANNAHTSDAAVAFDITVTDKVAKVVSKVYTTRELEYNSQSPRFAFYKNTQNDIYFIPWVEDPTPRISVSSNSIEVDAGATSCEFTYDLHNITGTPDVSVATGATMDNVVASVEGNTVTVKFDDNVEEIVKTATVILSIDGADEVEVTITQKKSVVEGEIAGGRDDFNTVAVNTSYTSRTTTAGWVGTNCAVMQGGTSDSNPTFTFIGSTNATRAFTMNGKTSAKGTITSPTLTTGCGKLSLKYGNAFSESNGVDFTVSIKQNGTAVQVYKVDVDSVTQKKAYTWEQDVNVTGDFVIEITNNCPSNNSSKNMDRVSIWDIEWTGYN